MTMPDPAPPRKPHRRFWLYAPYGLALVVAVIWSGVWLVLRDQVANRMDEAAAALRARGWSVAWSGRRIDGYPFRLDVTLDDPRLAEPSGWALAAPRLKGEAFAYAPRHWVLVAPGGLTLTRPGRGAVAIDGQALRASIDPGDGGAPRIAIEGLKLTFSPLPGAKALPIVACDHLGLYLRPAPGDQAEFQVNLQGARPAPGTLLARLAPNQPLDLVWDQSLTRASALTGPNWRAAVRAWSAAGGSLSLNHGAVSAGGASLGFTSGQLIIDDGGHPQGMITLDISRAGGSLARLGPAVALATMFHAQLTLVDGSLLLGPFRIGAAPKVY